MSKFITLTAAFGGTTFVERKSLIVSVMEFSSSNVLNEKNKINMKHCKSAVVVKRDSVFTPYPVSAERKVLNTTTVYVRETLAEVLKLIEE